MQGNGLTPTIFVIAFTSWAASARVLRGQTLSLRSRDYVLAARALDEPRWRIVLVELLPNLMPIIISQFTFAMIFAILAQAGLAFLGLHEPHAHLGQHPLLRPERAGPRLRPVVVVRPAGLCIALLGAGLALVNFGLDELLNPRLRVYRARKAAEEKGRRSGPGRERRLTWCCGRRTCRFDYDGIKGYAGRTRAVRGVSLGTGAGEVLGIAGESGCGKSTLAYALTRMLRPPATDRRHDRVTWTETAASGTSSRSTPPNCANFAGPSSRWCSRAR